MSILDDLNPEQRKAAEALEGPVMIVAGAGSGKTRVLTYRIAHLIQSSVRPENVLALTFTNKAAVEMKTRISVLVGQQSARIWAGTFHSIFARILRIECEHLGYSRNFTIYDTDDSLALIRLVMNGLKLSQQEFSPQAIQSRISRSKNALLTPREAHAAAADLLSERTATVYSEYQRRLKKNNAMDFDDLLWKPVELFRRFPDILERYHHRFHYVLVDEYQDTNRVQYLLIRELTAQRKNLCVVGDDAQSIYSFRGADLRNMLDFERDNPGCRVFRLEQNYRSTQSILSAANSVIKNNTAQIPKRLWTGNEAGDPVTVDRCIDDREEAQRIVTTIEEESHCRKLDLKHFAVLYRTNAQSRTLEDSLRRSSIPYVIVGGVAFYKRKEIKDSIAYLTLVVNPHDAGSLLRVLNVPPRGIGETTQAKLVSLSTRSGLSVFELLNSPMLGDTVQDRTRRVLKAFSAMMKKYISLKETMSLSELARALIDETGLLTSLKEENTPESLARRENIQELVSALTEFSEQNREAGLQDFLQEVALMSDIDTTDLGRNAVTLMTLHAAKGLEFQVVFMTGLEEGIFPLSSSLSSAEGLEEERRLMYVGMTRAMRKLYITHAGSRYRFGELSFMVRSRFLDEIDPSFVQTTEVGRRQSNAARMSRSASLVPPKRKRGYEDLKEPSPFPAYEDESQEHEELKPAIGLRVLHESFGRGRIVALDLRGGNPRAVVDFESVGRKQLLLKFAKLKTL